METPESLKCRPFDPAPGDPESANALFQGRYAFSGERRTALNEPPWPIEDTSDAWQADLNAFEWLADFRSTEAETARLRARELVRTWIDHNDLWRAIPWRLDVLGRRLISWASHADFLCGGAEPTFRRLFLASFAAQTRHLSRSAGLLNDGAWPLSAFAGRVVAEAALHGATKRLTSDVAALANVVTLEILPDGAVASRNSNDAISALRMFLITRSALEGLGLEMPPAIVDALKRMPLAAKPFRHGDGRFGIFNGSSEGDRAHIDAILAACKARVPTPAILPDAGFHRMSAGRTLALFDVGTPAPHPHSAHAGLLSFELSVGRDRVIVNCGINGAEQWKNAGRTTAAHSTLVIADTNSIDLVNWAKNGRSSPTVEASRREDDGNILVEASHTGYADRFGLRHDRALYVAPNGAEIRGEDSIVAVNEIGHRPRPFAIRFHLHPQVNTSLATDEKMALLRLAHGSGAQFRASAPIALEESAYLGTADGARETRQMVIYGETQPTGATTVKWALTLYPR